MGRDFIRSRSKFFVLDLSQAGFRVDSHNENEKVNNQANDVIVIQELDVIVIVLFSLKECIRKN